MTFLGVLIPLLLDDPLWDVHYQSKRRKCLNPSFAGWPTLGHGILPQRWQFFRLNPSFAGWPTLGKYRNTIHITEFGLNPSFAGWPTLGQVSNVYCTYLCFVLIPLLLDDPLWENKIMKRPMVKSLNPSFAGWPTLGDWEWDVSPPM